MPRAAGLWDGWSYDLAFLLKDSKANPPDDVTIIYVDDQTYERYGASEKDFNRAYYATTLDYLTRAGVKQVMIDVWFDPNERVPGAPSLAGAIRSNGAVFLVVELKKESKEVKVETPRVPLQSFVDAGARHGTSTLQRDEITGVVRQYNHGDNERPGFAWLAASSAGAQIGSDPDNALFLNYYGPPLTFRHVSLCDVTNHQQDPTIFKNKFVFIGSLPRQHQFPQQIVDSFPGPAFSVFGGKAEYAGVEIVATAFSNLMTGSGLHRMVGVTETLLLIAFGVSVGGGLVWLRPWPAALVALSLAVLIGVVSCLCVWKFYIWYSWAMTSFLQIPVALLWGLLTHTKALDRQNRELEETLSRTLREVEESRSGVKPASSPAHSAAPGAPGSSESPPMVADHVLLKRVGKGGYGEVWLGRNAVGLFHAIKLVYRKNFRDDLPYEREFKGIQKFMPISRSHPGFVHILHVGRNDDVGFFYCVMEAGDDETGSPLTDPATYMPKNLGQLIRAEGALPAKECIALGLHLSDALGHLHRENLIHRDIKPSNIIYASGRPKLADIGLVTEIETTLHDVSQLGTDGYMPPEGPGAPNGDLYSLGKVLYEACMGLDRRRFPELPTAVYESEESAIKLRLNRVILRACEIRPEDRYLTAEALATDLRACLVDSTG